MIDPFFLCTRFYFYFYVQLTYMLDNNCIQLILLNWHSINEYLRLNTLILTFIPLNYLNPRTSCPQKC